MLSPSSSETGFNLNKATDTTKSVIVNYSSIGLTSLFRDDKNNYITANCTLSSSSNVTYTENNVTTEYKANKLWFISNGEYSSNKTPMNQINGITSTGQLIIRNMNTNGDKIIFVCFPLQQTIVNQGAIDNILLAVKNNKSNFQVDLGPEFTPGTKYVEYTSTKGNNAIVLTYGGVIEIMSEVVKSLENKVDLFNLQPSEYNIIAGPVPGEWMECDYVPIDSDEVATYNLPVSSQLVQDSAAHDSFKTMIMFIIFILLAIACFTVIPASYVFFLGYVFKYSNSKTPDDQRKMMTKINQIIVILFSIVIIQCFYIGVFADPEQYPNYAQYLLWGIILSVIIGVCYLIMESKKTMSKDWPIEEIQRDQLDT
jgi:hypothetical protein